MSGISRLIAKELSSALGIIDNPKYNKMFKETEEVLTDVADEADPTVARFYSPLETALEEAPIGKEGTRGENIEAFVRKRAPKVTAAEMEYRGLGLEPDVKYTREVLSGIEQKEATDLVLREFSFLNKEADHKIYQDLDAWIYDNDPKALDRMVNIGTEYDTYKEQVQDYLSYVFPNKKIPVQRIEGYADPLSKKKKTVTTIDVDDVIAIGNPAEREIITKQPDTGLYVSYSLLTEDLLKPLEVKAIKKGSRYRNIQRQDSLQDKEIDYVELGLDASEDLGYTTHYGSSNLAHTRYSLRDGNEGNYILIEELQSDPLQNVIDDLSAYRKKEKSKLDEALRQSYESIEWVIENEGSGFADKPLRDIKSYIEDIVIPTRLNKTLSQEERVTIFKDAASKLGVNKDLVFGDTGSISRVANAILEREVDGSSMDYLVDGMYESVEQYFGSINAATTKKDLPVQKITDTIRIALQSIIADAKSKGVNEIVLPPVEKLAEKRFAAGEVASKVAKGSAFYNTYVTAYNKVLKQLKAELGNQIKIGKKPLKYADYVSDSSDLGFKEEVTTVQGTLLDITNLEFDPTKTRLRFNKGGLVERRTK